MESKKELVILNKFKEDFLKVKQMGWIPSNRFHDTGIGKTFEDLIGIVENNNRLADYKAVLELKSKRALSESMVTLFTKSPTFPKRINSILRVKYGQPDKNFPNCKIIHTTVSATRFNTFINKFGFKLEIDKNLQKVSLIVKDLPTDQIIDKDSYYSFKDLQNIIENKCKYIAVIYADNKKEGGKEYFKFTKAILMSGLDFDKFIKLVNEEIIVYDIRLGVYGTGKNKGKPHDHGSAFRLTEKSLPFLFKIHKKIL